MNLHASSSLHSHLVSFGTHPHANFPSNRARFPVNVVIVYLYTVFFVDSTCLKPTPVVNHCSFRILLLTQ